MAAVLPKWRELSPWCHSYSMRPVAIYIRLKLRQGGLHCGESGWCYMRLIWWEMWHTNIMRSVKKAKELTCSWCVRWGEFWHSNCGWICVAGNVDMIWSLGDAFCLCAEFDTSSFIFSLLLRKINLQKLFHVPKQDQVIVILKYSCT